MLFLQLSNAVRCLDNLFTSGFAAYRLVGLNRLLGFIGPLVVQMEHDGRIANLFGANAEVPEPLAKFAVLTAIVHILIIAINLQHILSPPRSIAAIPAGIGRCDEVEDTGIERRAEEFAAFE